MPKRKIRLVGLREYDPERTLSRHQVRNAYVENIDFNVTGAGLIRGLPGFTTRAIAGTQDEHIGTAALLNSHVTGEESYVWFDGTRLYVYDVQGGALEMAQNLAGATFGDNEYYTLASDGQAAYLGLGNEQPAKRIIKPQHKRFGAAVPTATRIEDATLLPPASPSHVYMTPDTEFYNDVDDSDNRTQERLFRFNTQAFDIGGGATNSWTHYWSNEWTAGVPFDANLRYFYKLSYTYYGFLESPLVDLKIKRAFGEVTLANGQRGNSFYHYGREDRYTGLQYWAREDRTAETGAPPMRKYLVNTDISEPWLFGTDASFIPYKLVIPDINDVPFGVTGINLYYAPSVERHSFQPSTLFSLVDTFDIQELQGYYRTNPNNRVTVWVASGDEYTATFKDEALPGPTFERRTGISEVVEDYDIRWRISQVVQGKMAIASVTTPADGYQQNLVLISEFDRFSVFNYIDKRFRTKNRPTAIVEYYGRMLVFEEGHTYVVDPDFLRLTDEWSGIGASGPQSVFVNDRGLFFANHRNLYWAAGAGVKAIGDEVLFNRYASDAGFERHDQSRAVQVLYDSNYDLALFFWQRGADIRGWAYSPKR